MGKILLSILTVLFPTIAVFCQQRSAKDIEKMFKKVSQMEALLNAGSFQEGNFLKTIVLSERTTDLNAIERELIDTYAQVAVMCNIKGKPFCCYFVKDDENKRGIVGLDGKVMVPPLSGYICNIPNGNNFGLLLVGELSSTTSSDLFQKWGDLIKSRDNNILGLFSAIVVDADKPTIHSLFPLDKYIFLSLGSKGNGKFDIFTLKAVGDEALWGIVDMKGKEILPNKYTGFYRKGHLLDGNNTGLWGKWVGSTEMDMSEALNYGKDLKADTQRRRNELASALNSVGESMIGAAESIEAAQDYLSGNAASGDSETTVSGDLPTRYSKWAGLAERHYNSLTNLGSKAKKGGKDAGGSAGQGMSPSNYTQMKKSLREAQSEMKRIRQKARKQGINIPKSEYEDIQVKY